MESSATFAEIVETPPLLLIEMPVPAAIWSSGSGPTTVPVLTFIVCPSTDVTCISLTGSS